jgi:hypothetical protein
VFPILSLISSYPQYREKEKEECSVSVIAESVEWQTLQLME